jgi:hypothetical protein
MEVGRGALGDVRRMAIDVLQNEASNFLAPVARRVVYPSLLR